MLRFILLIRMIRRGLRCRRLVIEVSCRRKGRHEAGRKTTICRRGARIQKCQCEISLNQYPVIADRVACAKARQLRGLCDFAVML